MNQPVALVTGGARRLGASLARALAGRGHRVIIVYRSAADDALVLAEKIGGRAAQCDVADETSVAALFESVDADEGRLDLLVNNVGNYEPAPVRELTPKKWDAMLGSNLSGTYYCCHHALARMKSGGHIVNIGTAGLERAVDVDAVEYYIGKQGVLMLTRALAKAYAPAGIRVNMISPGILTNSIDFPNDIARWVPLGRAGALSDIAGALRYLLDAPYVTGVNLDVAGGYRL